MLAALALLLAWRLSPCLLLEAYLAWSLWESLKILWALEPCRREPERLPVPGR